MDLISVFPYRERRIRVEFSGPVAVGGLSTSHYTVTSEDSSSASPNIRVVYAVAGHPNVVELVLEFAMVEGSAYTVLAGSVPAVAGGSTAPDATQRFRYAFARPQVNVEPVVSDQDVILFGRDLVWNGDFEEGADGDLARVAGVPNAVGALDRRLKGSPLPYASGYSPNAREFVDSNDATPLGARLRQQSLRDPRVKSVKIDVTEDAVGNTVFVISPKFIGDRSPEPISMTVET